MSFLVPIAALVLAATSEGREKKRSPYDSMTSLLQETAEILDGLEEIVRNEDRIEEGWDKEEINPLIEEIFRRTTQLEIDVNNPFDPMVVRAREIIRNHLDDDLADYSPSVAAKALDRAAMEMRKVAREAWNDVPFPTEIHEASLGDFQERWNFGATELWPYHIWTKIEKILKGEEAFLDPSKQQIFRVLARQIDAEGKDIGTYDVWLYPEIGMLHLEMRFVLSQSSDLVDQVRRVAGEKAAANIRSLFEMTTDQGPVLSVVRVDSPGTEFRQRGVSQVAMYAEVLEKEAKKKKKELRRQLQQLGYGYIKIP
jgi:hypothetical protein